MNFFPNIFKNQKNVGEIAGDIVQMLTERSFEKFRESAFRELINFKGLDEEEQDRIFNELVITAIALIYLTLERGEMENIHEKSQKTFRDIKNNLAGAYVGTLASFGVEKQFTDLWHQLIAMRCEEYRDDFKNHREIFFKENENYWIYVCAIGGCDHICRGEIKDVEKLLPDITNWCGDIYIEGMRIVAKEVQATNTESGKITKVSIGDDGKIQTKDS